MDCVTLTAAADAAVPHLVLKPHGEDGLCVLLGKPAVVVELHSYRPPPVDAGRVRAAGLEGHRRGTSQSFTLVQERVGVDRRFLVRAIGGGAKSDAGRMHRVDLCFGEGAVRVRGTQRHGQVAWDDVLAIVAYRGALCLGGVVWQHEADGWARYSSPRAWRELYVLPWMEAAPEILVQDELRLARARKHELLADLLESRRRRSA